MSKILLIYDEIGYWGTTAKDVAQFLVDNKGESVEVHINSPGGDVFEAFAIYNNLKNTPDCTIYIDGIAASAAAIIALCGHPLKMANVSQLMLHSASTYTSGNKKDMEEQISFLDSIDTTLASMIATKLGKEVDEVKNLYFDGKDHWISASECKEMGICEIWEPSPEDRANLQKITACWRNTTIINQKTHNTMLQKLQTVQAFMNCHTEEEAMVRINDMVSKNAELTARVAELEKTEQKYNDMIAQQQKEQAEADYKVIEDAVKDGRITDEMKPVYVDMMSKDRENAHKIINSLVKKAEEKKVEKVSEFIKEDKTKEVTDFWETKKKEIAERNKR